MSWIATYSEVRSEKNLFFGTKLTERPEVRAALPGDFMQCSAHSHLLKTQRKRRA